MAKYRQHGYQDRDHESRKPSGEKSAPSAPKKDNTFGPRPVNLPGTRAVSRCTQCGTVLQGIPSDEKCPKCGFELHSCKQCTYFDPGSRFECMQPVKERIAKKKGELSDLNTQAKDLKTQILTAKAASAAAPKKPK